MQITVSDCRQIVGTYYRIPKSVMLSRCRKRSVARPRQMAMTLAREFTGASFPRIGQQFGGLDHTTALHAFERIHDLEGYVPSIREDMAKFRNVLTALRAHEGVTLMDAAE